MRKLKFRVWNGEQMVSPDYITRKGEAVWKENSIVCVEEKNVMQFTGIEDRNGIDIYEGDIIKLIFSKISSIGVVEWGEYSDGEYVHEVECWIAHDLPISDHKNLTFGHDACELEIIGNIYNNPEIKINQE